MSIVKLGFIGMALVIMVAIVMLKPIVLHEHEYKVIIVNTSEHAVNNVVLHGPESSSGNIGPIQVGKLQDYFFSPRKDGVLRYTILQNNKTLQGVVNNHLKKGDTGKKYLVIGELYKVRIYDEFDT